MSDLYKKYRKIFGYVDTIVFTYLKSGKNLERFKQISMDYDDIKQEVYIELLRALQEYESKYENKEKVHLEPYVKKLVSFVTSNLLRNNRNKIFISIEQDLQEENSNLVNTIKSNNNYKLKMLFCTACQSEVNQKVLETKIGLYCACQNDLQEDFDNTLWVERLPLPPSKGELIHPDLIPSVEYKDILSLPEIINVLKETYSSDIDYKIMKLRIIDGYTLDEIAKAVGLKSKQAVKYKLNKGFEKLKKKYKDISQLFT